MKIDTKPKKQAWFKIPNDADGAEILITETAKISEAITASRAGCPALTVCRALTAARLMKMTTIRRLVRNVFQAFMP